MTIKIVGTLYWGNMSWLLTDPHPTIEREHWMKDQDETFLVCDILGRQFKATVSRPFAVTDERKGDEIEVFENKKAAIYGDKPEWLENLLKSEPASLAE